MIASNHFNFYALGKNRTDLVQKLDALDKQARTQFNAFIPSEYIKAIIAPHAGYIYSGNVAASVYLRLQKEQFNRIVILAPSHFIPFNGIALPEFTHYKTPLGSIAIDCSVVNNLARNALFTKRADAFTQEHSLEMQLPLLQKYAGTFQLVPLIVGSLSVSAIEGVAHALAEYADKQTLFIASSDFTHYGSSFEYTPFKDHIPYRIMPLDSTLLRALYTHHPSTFLELINQTHAPVCGKNPIAILMQLIAQRALGTVEPHLVAYHTSGELAPAGPNYSSVSYAGLLYTQPYATPLQEQLNAYEKHALLGLARATLAFYLSSKPTVPFDLLVPVLSPTMLAPYAAFVTVYNTSKQPKKLRGCLGVIETDEPLYRVIIDHARALAEGKDTRFAPLTENELRDITLEISVLTKPHPIARYQDVVLGTHGIILSNGLQRALFLPKVPVEFAWDLATTLTQLSIKAGLNPNAWRDTTTTFEVFESIDFEETHKKGRN